MLWVPVRYYHRPPAYFRGWAGNRPPRWGAHWGPRWQEAHNRIYTGQRSVRIERAPLPQYQRQFTRDNYPRGAQQQSQLHGQQYAYRPREGVVQQQYQARGIAAQHAVAQQQHAGGNQGQVHRGGGDEHRGR